VGASGIARTAGRAATDALGTRVRWASGVVARLIAALVAALVLAPSARAADAWPMHGHDAANSNRSSVVSAQGPALLPGWPRSDLAGPLLVAPGGAVLAPGPEAPTPVLNPDGTRQRVLPVGPLSAIGPDGRLYSWRSSGDPVSAYGPAGDLLWRAPGGPGYSVSSVEVRPGPDGSAYAIGVYGMVALDASGGVRWRQALDRESYPGPVAVGSDGAVYLGLPSGRTPTVAARAPDGRALWQAPLIAPAERIAVADDGTVIAAGAAYVAALRPDGSARWTAPGPGTGVDGMALGADGSVYLTASGVVHALGPDGGARWTFGAGGEVRGDPIVGGDGTIYVGGRRLVALRPDGSRAWSFPLTSGPLRPEAIGADGTLFASVGGGRSPVLALAGPSAPVRVAPASAARQRALVAALRVRPTRFRLRGPVSVCPAPRRGCRPATPLGATLAFTLRRDSAVLAVIRRPDGAVAARRAWHARAGTTWTGLRDAADYRPLAPGRYALTVRAASGAARVTSGPVRFTVVRG
jgi:outer membrane protein assembly factor BamB